MKKRPRSSPPAPRRSWRRWPWYVEAGLAVVLVGAIFYLWQARGASRGPGPAPEGMVWIPPGEFWMGSDDPNFRDAWPVHLVYVDGFWMDKTEVTNEQFARFVEETGYKTIAERKPRLEDFPAHLRKEIMREKLVPGAALFIPPDSCPADVDCDDCNRWWKYVPGACWKRPEGPGSSIEGRQHHPVVHVAWDDAVAYARWAGRRLPTEAEWERAARGGLEGERYYWGNELTPNGRWMANIWQGKFPTENTAEDGFRGTAPVGSFPANGYGLHDMAGNVWEWCSDWYHPTYYAISPTRNPKGPDESFDPHGHGEPKRVLRGGSFLCNDDRVRAINPCLRYRAGARHQGEPKTSMSHTGFRCVKDAR
jgi:formylglycine-generating enzyme required for sulfatase activity